MDAKRWARHNWHELQVLTPDVLTVVVFEFPNYVGVGLFHLSLGHLRVNFGKLGPFSQHNIVELLPGPPIFLAFSKNIFGHTNDAFEEARSVSFLLLRWP